jgi:diguanylate cyclase (GGDEF)-like protein
MSLKTSIAMHLRAARKKIHSRQRGFFLIFIWPALAVVAGVLGWGALLATLERDQAQVAEASLRQAAALARSYATQIDRTLRATDRLILHVREEWQLSGGRLKLEETASSGLFPPASMFFVAITDRNGNLLTSTIAGDDSINVADRPYFVAHQNKPDDFLHVGTPPAAQWANSNVIQFSRKLPDNAGDFGGVVLASVSPSYLTSSYDDSALGNNGYLGIHGEDNAIRVGRAGKNVTAPSDPILLTMPGFQTPGGSMLMEGNDWFADGRSRYVGWQMIPDYPLHALTGLDVQDTLAPLQARRKTAIHLATGATLGLGLFTIVAMLLSMRLSTRKHQLRIAQATYRKATEESSEGFYIARPVVTPAGTDYQIVDCNHYGAALFGLCRVDLIGKRISTLGKSAAVKLVLSMLNRARESGFHEEEVKVPRNIPIGPEWLRFKAVQSEGQLAVTLRDISDAKAHLEELERRSNEDELTGLPNRHWAKNYLIQAIARAAHNNQALAVLYVDLDGFKAVNDTMGHAAGDELLCNAARRLKLAVRPQDHVVRLGGDEFVLILEHVSSASEVAPVAERVLQVFRQNFRLSQGVYTVGTSIGISMFPNDGNDADSLLHHADIAMYAVKTSGKASYRFYNPKLFEALRVRHEKEAELRRAIETDQFIMYYQPRIELTTGMTCSMESLVRWNHPTKGLTGPDEFIPLAEETGLILDLGELIVDKVIAQLSAWMTAGSKLVPVSINVSPRQFREADVKGIFSAALARHRVDPALVEIEVTESSMMGDGEDVSNTLNDIHRMGIKLLVDDFGTGYSSLSQLQQLDFDVLKVDRAFTSKIDSSAQGNVLFKAIITMAHALGMRVVAEGVESEEQVRILRLLHCDELQGFFISRPLPPAEIQPVLPRFLFPSAA